MIASRYLRARRNDAFISVIATFSFAGIVVGVMTLIIVLAVMNGFRADLLDRLLNHNSHMSVASANGRLDGFEALAKRIREIEGVVLVMPVEIGEALASGPNGPQGVRVRGLRRQDLRSLPDAGRDIHSGTLETFESAGGIVLGLRLAVQLGVALGDQVTLVSPARTATEPGGVPRVQAYRILAVLGAPKRGSNRDIIYMPLVEAQRYFDRGDTVSALEIYVEDPESVEAMRAPVLAAADRPIDLIDWSQANATLFGALRVERTVMFVILSLIVLVAALNITAGLTMLVNDKAADIAVLRTMGASRAAVMRIFIFTGAAIGSLGTFAGFAAGYAVAANADGVRSSIRSLVSDGYLPSGFDALVNLPSRYEITDSIPVVLLSLCLSVLATIYPAWRAARLNPVEVLRYE